MNAYKNSIVFIPWFLKFRPSITFEFIYCLRPLPTSSRSFCVRLSVLSASASSGTFLIALKFFRVNVLQIPASLCLQCVLSTLVTCRFWCSFDYEVLSISMSFVRCPFNYSVLLTPAPLRFLRRFDYGPLYIPATCTFRRTVDYWALSIPVLLRFRIAFYYGDLSTPASFIFRSNFDYEVFTISIYFIFRCPFDSGALQILAPF